MGSWSGIPDLPSQHVLTSTEAKAITDLLKVAPETYIARKLADESVSSATTGTTLHNDSELFIPSLQPSAVYTIQSWFATVGPGSTTTGNMKIGWTYPAGALMSWGASGMEKASLTTTATAEGKGEFIAFTGLSSPSPTITYAAGVNTLSVIGSGMIVMGANAGTLQVQWAQDANNATNTTMKFQSWLLLQRVA